MKVKSGFIQIFEKSMRNPFDQYEAPENRLTHALACCLAEDSSFLLAFIKWATGENPPKGTPVQALQIEEQSIPGREEEGEEKVEKRGVPDACIHDGGQWCLLVESKVAAPINGDQILRHLRTAELQGFSDRRIVVLSVNPSIIKAKANVHHRAWKELYGLLRSRSWATTWPIKLIEYMAVAEGRMVADAYLKEGTLTSFEGVPFDRKTPYSYREAKRILCLLMGELKARPSLSKKLGARPDRPGRDAITGTSSTSVWDFIPLGDGAGEIAFTRRPHLTLSIHHDHALAQITVPNGVDGALRKPLIALGSEGFQDLMRAILKGFQPCLAKEPAGVPYLMLLQRHYLSQRSEGIQDARLEFDLRTSFVDKKCKVKGQPEWLALAYQAFSKRKSNLQLSVGMKFFYNRCPSVRSRMFIDIVEGCWLGCNSLLKAMPNLQNGSNRA